MSEQQSHEQSEAVRLATFRRLIAQLPVTLRPSLNQQLDQWDMLFPFEQNRLAEFLGSVESFQPAALDSLTQPLRALERKMGVAQWGFSTDRDTVENASMLARSAYYAEWRRAVQQIFTVVDNAARNSAPAQARPTRLVLLILPETLPTGPQTAWQEISPRGHEIRIAGDSRRLFELMMQGQSGQPGIATLLARSESADSSDLWLIDAEAKLDSLLSAATPTVASRLSYVALAPFRDELLAGLNAIPRNIEGADQIIAALRQKDWKRWWPPELADQPKLRNFVMELFLSGNGALIFSNAFVEWGASEALRRARPRILVARFGMRSKPKPFTSIAIFENQQRISSLPDVNDPEGSAIDAAILARYVWLAASRYPEQEQTICVCISEFRNSAYVIPLTAASPAWNPERAVTPEEIYTWIAAQLAN
jgi:hypothetical protein